MYGCKLYLLNSDSTVKEIRMFEVNDLYLPHMTFTQLREKVLFYFPELTNQDFTISWKDDEGDTIRIATDAEFDIAFRTMSKNYKLYIKMQSQKQELPTPKGQKVYHPNIICDSCDGDILGFRYKCIQCEDYDLCSNCETLGLHSEHCMIRMPQPLQWSSFHGKRLLHHMKKFFRKSGIDLAKEAIPDECQKRGRRCHEQSKKNINCFTLTETLGSSLFNIPSKTIVNPMSSNEASRCTDESKEKDNKDAKSNCEGPKTTVKNVEELLNKFGIEIDLSFIPDILDQINKPAQEKATEESVSKDENTTKNVPEEEKKSRKPDDKPSMSDSKSVIYQNTPVEKTSPTDEWTIVDRNEATDISQASSVSSSLNEIPEKQVSSHVSVEPSAPNEIPPESTLYPQLPKEEEIYHTNPKIHNAVLAMVEMGFSNKDKLLTYLLEAEYGDIGKVLDLLQHRHQ
ncbi:uncharacterized protein LOC143180223 [Calliopsis andreniformis]|uniref:uncharacterized protein LOC143180223 n=1 Tax=Calliopsis andreniformis TaxID=337506 RepID=UPI003FCEB098